MPISRRQFMRESMTAAAAISAAAGTEAHAQPERRPNIVVILTDQQHAGMLSCAGNSGLKTPNMDRIAAEGCRFERAYSANPVCIPARFSIMSGVYPSVIGMENHSHHDNSVPREVLAHSMGNVFREAGYETVYGGKIHLPGPGNVKEDVAPYGFTYITPDDHEGREGTAQACADFIRKQHERPFLLYASILNPHDICYMALNAHRRANNLPVGGARHNQELAAALELPEGVSEEAFFAEHCPPLPENYEIPQGELSAVLDDKPEFMSFAREHWGEREWRLHRWAYARLTERADAHVGVILNALEEAGLLEDTIVVFTSDHGDQDAAHRLEHKAFLYEESAHIPLFISWKGVTAAGRVDKAHLVCNGIDLLPTLADFAGISARGAWHGRSLKPLAMGKPVEDWRDHLVVENSISRLVHMGRWKYMVSHEKPRGRYDPFVREMVVDLEQDPGEMRNAIGAPDAQEALALGRARLQEWYAARGMQLDEGYVVES